MVDARLATEGNGSVLAKYVEAARPSVTQQALSDPTTQQIVGERCRLEEVRAQLERLADPRRAEALQRYFKTGPGEYGEGDVFVGIKVPLLRKLAKQLGELPLGEIEALLKSAVHEERFLALLLLIRAYARADESGRERIYALYLANTEHVNNWDLVDVSAEHIVGAHLLDKSKEPLYALARSESLWERRIAVLSTFHYIKRGRFDESLKIAALLLSDGQDLIHKAVGWMLREVGERDVRVEERFVRRHHGRMPRTMLRYAIERFPEGKRQAYLKGTVPATGSGLNI
jgi:3-methyladenine DNA glycosylase AlkD